MDKSIKKILLSLFVVYLISNISYPQANKFVASKNSNKYHLPTCKWALKINPVNLIEFKNADEALRAGYIPCKTCKPQMSKGEMIKQKSSEENQKYTKPTDGGRCQAITKKGTQCKRKAQAGSIYCWQHGR